MFNKYVDFYLKMKEYELKKSSFVKYQSIITHYMLPFFSTYSIQEANKMSTIRLFLLEIKNLSPKGGITEKFKKDVLLVLRGILQEAYYDEVIPKNNADLLRPLKPIKPIIKPFASHEVKALLQESKGWFRVYLALSFYTGLRTGEAFALHVSDIDLKHNIIRISKTRGKHGETTPKTASSFRDVPIFDTLKPILMEHLRKVDTKHVFINNQGNPFNCSKNITLRHFHPLLERLGYEKRRIYETRHTFATNMLESGRFSVNEIARLMGHTNTQMIFSRYTRFIESERRNPKTSVDIYNKS